MSAQVPMFEPHDTATGAPDGAGVLVTDRRRLHTWRELDHVDRPAAVEAHVCEACGLQRVRYSHRAHHVYERRSPSGALLDRYDRAPACTEAA